jgi:hypothetical protein
MEKSRNYSRLESEEIWQIIEHLVGMGYSVTQTKSEADTLTVTLSVPLLTKKHAYPIPPSSKTM